MHSKGTRNSGFIWLASGLSISIFTAAIGLYNTLRNPAKPDPASAGISANAEPQTIFGFDVECYDIDYMTLKRNDFLGNVLNERGVSYPTIDKLARSAEDVFSVRRLRPYKQCAIIREKESGVVECFVYVPNAYEFVRFHTGVEPYVEIHRKEVEKCVEQSSGTIEGSLWYTMDQLGHPYELIALMEDAFSWVVSFQHIQNGDTYKLIYERDYIDGVPVGVGRLLAAAITTGERTTNSIFYESERYHGFFDPEGRPMRRAFLKSPVRYSRISSRYSTRRFHPVLKRYKGHFGTDYAAPHGTPILAVADGTITKASYTKGNGNYIKMRHDKVYETQYLHMSKFAAGIKPGVRVKQGDVIGYVGSTGLATGPHVCFRFWKNGKQVDHLRENLPPPDPMSEEELPAFYLARDEILPQLQQIRIESPATLASSTP